MDKDRIACEVQTVVRFNSNRLLNSNNMAKKNKYNYLLVIQQHYTGSYGWEDVSEYEATSADIGVEKTEVTVISNRSGLPIKKKVSLCSQDAKNYRETGYPTRVILRRESNLDYNK